MERQQAIDSLVIEPIFQDELEKRIDQSESDFQNNRFKTSAQLLAKYGITPTQSPTAPPVSP